MSNRGYDEHIITLSIMVARNISVKAVIDVYKAAADLGESTDEQLNIY